MAEWIDISNDKFWDILFDEACVEGKQAERIEKELKQIATTEAEIREKAISDFLKALEELTKKNWIDHLEYGITWADLELVVDQLKEE